MCGIAGRFNLQSDELVTFEAVAAMCQALQHRGPDDDGIYLDAEFGMGMRRLSIIDLATGHQPMHNEDGSIWAVCNGEIYNYLELRALLQSNGHTFYTHADTEVIVHLYEVYGEDFVTHLTGMFAIAVWDRRWKKLTLARDRLGIKPLYYSVDPQRLLFGSEIKAILQSGLRREIDPQALHDYLSLNYVPGPCSIFKGIWKLPPGYLLTCQQGTICLRPYWQLQYPQAPANADKRSTERYREELYTLLQTCVRQHLRSDVPAGIFLSGGIDSSSLVALVRNISSQPLRTFSIGFEERSYDELGEARAVARAFDTEHHELVIRSEASALLPELVRYFDEPCADSSAVAVYWLSKLAREHVKVVLSGEGGDEVFAGYETYTAYRLAELYKRLPRRLATTVIPAIIRRLPVSHRRVSFDYKAKRFVDGALLPPADGHFRWKVIFTEQAKAALYGRGVPGLRDSIRLWRAAYAECAATDPLVKLQHIDLRIYLPDDLLVKADRMSMAHALEVRVPFLDHRIVEFAASLPSQLKLRGLRTKYILRRTMSPHLPGRILTGKKRGFNVPIPIWLRRDLRDLVHDTLNPQRIKDMGLFKPAAVCALLRDHEERRVDYSRHIWGLLVFHFWYEEYMRASGTARKPTAA